MRPNALQIFGHFSFSEKTKITNIYQNLLQIYVIPQQKKLQQNIPCTSFNRGITTKYLII